MKTPQQYQNEALDLAGAKSQNAIFEIRFANANSGGVWTASFNGNTTPQLAYNVASSDIRSALWALPSIGAGGADVTGVRKGPYFVEMQGANAAMLTPPLTVNGSLLVPVQIVVVNVVQEGQSNSFAAKASGFWIDFEAVPDLELRKLFVAKAVLEIRIAGLSDRIDTEAGQIDRQRVSSRQLFLNAMALQDTIDGKIADALEQSHLGARRTVGGMLNARTPNDLPLFGMSYSRRNGRFG